MTSIILSAVVAVVVAGLTGWLTYLAATRGKEIEATATPYDQIAARVSTLEQQVNGLMHDQWVDRTYMRQLLTAWPSGHTLPQPMPGWIALHYGIQPEHPPTPGSIIEPHRKDR